MPDPFTDLTVTETASGNPLATISAQHTGTDLDRIEVLYRVDSGAWQSVLLALATDLFVSGTTYQVQLPSPDGAEWAMVAVDSGGVRSA